ncbi:MAG: TonB-dependent receptor plug domain-containing protein [Pyrinomonadaceae bacterium]
MRFFSVRPPFSRKSPTKKPVCLVQRTSPTIGAVLVRGLTEVGVYVDGVRYTNSTQRGGINTFFNLNEPTGLQSVEIQRSPNTAQFGSDGLGGNVQLISRQPEFGFDKPQWNGEFNSFFTSSDYSFGSNALVGYGTKQFGILGNIVARRINTLRTGGGFDSHSAITQISRFAVRHYRRVASARHSFYAIRRHVSSKFRADRRSANQFPVSAQPTRWR